MAAHRLRNTLVTGLIGTIAAAAGVTTYSAAYANPQPDAPTSEMPVAVEDFSYPNATRIQQDQQITLKRGDGHIMLTGCDGAPDITVKSRTGQKTYCFKVSAKQGYLALELPSAYGMWTEAHPVQATITADGKQTVVSAPANDYKPFGEAGDAKASSVLVELRVTS